MANFNIEKALQGGMTRDEVDSFLQSRPDLVPINDSDRVETTIPAFGKAPLVKAAKGFGKEIIGGAFTLGEATLGTAGSFAEAATKLADIPFKPLRKGTSYLRKLAGFQHPEIPSLTEQFGAPARELLQKTIPEEAAIGIEKATGLKPRETTLAKGLPLITAALSLTGAGAVKLPKTLKDIIPFLAKSTAQTMRVKAGTEAKAIPTIDEISTGAIIDFLGGKLAKQAGKIFRFGVQPEVPGKPGAKLPKIEKTAQEAAGVYAGTKKMIREKALKQISEQSEIASRKLTTIKTEYDPYQFIDGVFRRAEAIGKLDPKAAEIMLEQAQSFLNGYKNKLKGGNALWNLEKDLGDQLEKLFHRGATGDATAAAEKQALDEIWKSVGAELKRLGVEKEFRNMSVAYAVKKPVTLALEKPPSVAIPFSTRTVPGGTPLFTSLAKAAKTAETDIIRAIARRVLKETGKKTFDYLLGIR